MTDAKKSLRKKIPQSAKKTLLSPSPFPPPLIFPNFADRNSVWMCVFDAFEFGKSVMLLQILRIKKSLKVNFLSMLNLKFC